jgi:glycosyltransferase involved in cell wall biosynthesis
VLWIAERFPPDRGGLAISAARQVHALAPHVERLDVLRLTADLAPGAVELDERGAVTLFRVGRARESDESLQLLTQTALNLVARHHHRLVHGFGAVHAGYVAAWVGRRRDVPSVVSLRGNDLERAMFHGPRLPFLTWTLEHATALLGVTAEIVGSVRALTGRVDRVHHVPNGVDTTVFRPDAGPSDDVRALTGCPRPWIGFAGEARLKKGLPLLLDVATVLAATAGGTMVLIGGVRADAGATIARGRRTAGAATQRVREVPYTSDPRRLAGTYAAMDVFAFPSLWDGMPNALLEAMASARPVIAAATGGCAEVVRDGVTGVLVPVERLGDLAHEVMRLCQRPGEHRARLGASAREVVAREFTVEAERDAILDVYRSLVA